MKKLVISVFPLSTTLTQMENRIKDAMILKGKVNTHYEVGFSRHKDFKRFISNIDLLTSIRLHKPQSIYELAKILNKDIGNLNKLINFFENLGVIIVESKTINGRQIKRPVVPYQKIEFVLAA